LGCMSLDEPVHSSRNYLFESRELLTQSIRSTTNGLGFEREAETATDGDQ